MDKHWMHLLSYTHRTAGQPGTRFARLSVAGRKYPLRALHFCRRTFETSSVPRFHACTRALNGLVHMGTWIQTLISYPAFGTLYRLNVHSIYVWLRGDGPTPRLDPHSSPVRPSSARSVHWPPRRRRPTTIASAATQAARHASTFGQRQKTLEILVVLDWLLLSIDNKFFKNPTDITKSS